MSQKENDNGAGQTIFQVFTLIEAINRIDSSFSASFSENVGRN